MLSPLTLSTEMNVFPYGRLILQGRHRISSFHRWCLDKGLDLKIIIEGIWLNDYAKVFDNMFLYRFDLCVSRDCHFKFQDS